MWKRAGRPKWETWVTPVTGERVVCSTGTADESRAKLMEAWLTDLHARRDLMGVLAAVAGREITLAKAYSLGEAGAAALVASLRAEKAEQAKAIDVWPVLKDWVSQRASGAKPVKTAATTLQMARHVFPEDPCPVTLWTPDEIERRLADLKGKTWKGKARPIQDATRNRYRTALSVCAEHLRRKKLLTINPVEAVPSYDENALTFGYIDLADAKKLIGALTGEGQIAAAFALGFGAEWCALAQLEVRDLNLTEWECHVKGGKSHWRDRIVPLSDEFAFLQPIMRAAVKDKLPRTKLITEPEWRLLDQQKATAEAIGVKPITLHQWRHTCAVALLQAGELPPNVAHVLGHKDTALVFRRYGRFLVKSKHFATRKGSALLATNLATKAANS